MSIEPHNPNPNTNANPNRGSYRRGSDPELDDLMTELHTTLSTLTQAASQGEKKLFSRLRGSSVTGQTEVRDFINRLAEIGGRLSRPARGQLRRDVASAIRSLSKDARWWVQTLNMPRRHRIGDGMDDKTLVERLRRVVHAELDAIIPMTIGNAADAAPPGSVLPPASRAVAQGRVAPENLDRHLTGRGAAWWREQMHVQGLAGISSALLAETDHDAIEALRLLPYVAGGIVLGDTLTPDNREVDGVAVVKPNQSIAVLGSSGSGKTKSVITKWAHQQAALGASTMVTTPMADTVKDILPVGQALTGQADVLLVDFGGELVKPGSPGFVAYNPVRGCRTDDKVAKRRADAFAGPHHRIRQQLNSPDFWGGIVEDCHLWAMAVADGMEELYGLCGDEDGTNGLKRVHHLLSAPLPDDAPDALIDEFKAELDDPGIVERNRALYEEAQERAMAVHPRLRRIIFHKHVLEANGLTFSKRYGDPQRVSFEKRLNDAAPPDGRDQLETVLNLFFESVPEHEVRVMSPMRGEREVDPRDFVRPNAGLSFVVYSQIQAGGGVGAGILTGEVLEEAVKQNIDDRMRDMMGGAPTGVPLAVVLDEGEAAEHLSGLQRIFTNYRQVNVSMLLSMTSEAQLTETVGQLGAGKVTRGPILLDLTPIGRAAEYAALFGLHIVDRVSEATNPDGQTTTTRTPTPEAVVDASQVGSKLKVGEGILVNQSDRGGVRVRFVGLTMSTDPATVFGAALEDVVAQPERFEPIQAVAERLRPDLAEELLGERLQLEAGTTGRAQSGEAVARPADRPVDAEVVDQAIEAGPAKPVQPAAPSPAEPKAVASAPVDPTNALAALLAEAISAMPADRVAALTEALTGRPVEPAQIEAAKTEAAKPAEAEAVDAEPAVKAAEVLDDPIVGMANGHPVTRSEWEVLKRVMGFPDPPMPDAAQKAIDAEAAKKAAEDEAAQKAAEDDAAQKAAEAEAAQKAAEGEAAKKAAEAEAAKKAAEAEAAKKAAEAEAARQAAEAEAARQAAEDEAAKKAAEDEAAKKAIDAEAAKKAAEDEAAKKAADADAAQTAAEDEAAKKAIDAEAAKKAAEDEAAKKAADADAAQTAAEAEAAKKAIDAEAAKKAAEDEAAKKAADADAAQTAAEAEAAKKAAEDEAAKKAIDADAAQTAAEAEAAKKAAEDEAAKKAAEDEAAKKAAEDEAAQTATESNPLGSDPFEN